MNQHHYKIVGVVVLVLFSLSFFTSIRWLAYIAMFIGVAAFSFEAFAVKFANLWMKFGKVLGDINATIILSILFFLLLTPISFLKRLFSKKVRTNPNSSWVNVENESINFDKPW